MAALTKNEALILLGGALGLGLGILFCTRHVFGLGAPGVNLFPQPRLPGLYGYDELSERDWASLGAPSRYGARGFWPYG